MALDLCSQLTLVLDEAMVLRRIIEIFSILFAPRQIIFRIRENGAVTSTLTYPESAIVPSLLQEPGMVQPETTPTGFRLHIPYKAETVGDIEVDGLAFPAFRERYLSLALAISGVCGLAIVNARTHHRLEGALSDLKREYARSSGLSQELQAINDQLEERVRQRTAELEKTARSLEEEVRQRRAAEEVVRSQLAEKTLLLRELHHRVKNNLQLITSMLSIQARKVQDPSLHLALNESRNRIRTMAFIHEKLWVEHDLSHIDMKGYAWSILSRLISLYQVKPDQVSLAVDIPDVVVDINTAIPVGLILNELIANSLKHAFPDGKTGEIFLVIHDEGSSLSIICRDNGSGMPPGYDWENPETVGLILVHSLVGQLQGTIEKEPGVGTRFLIRVQKSSGESGTVQGTYNQIPE